MYLFEYLNNSNLLLNMVEVLRSFVQHLQTAYSYPSS